MAITSERGNLIFKKTERDLVRLRHGHQPDVVHSFRTCSRRLQVLLEQLVPAHDRNQKKLLKALSRIRKRAGRIRDLDVQLVALRSLKVPLEPRRKTQLTQQLIELRHKHEKKLGKVLKKKYVAELLKRLKRANKSINLDDAADPLKAAQQMIAVVENQSGSTINEDLLHRYRLTVKRARYAAEFAPNSDAAAQLISQLKKLQDALGHWHDWFTLTQTASQHLGDIHQSPLVAALHNVTRGKYRSAVAEVARSKDPSLAGSSIQAVPARKKDSTGSALTESAENAA